MQRSKIEKKNSPITPDNVSIIPNDRMGNNDVDSSDDEFIVSSDDSFSPGFSLISQETAERSAQPLGGLKRVNRKLDFDDPNLTPEKIIAPIFVHRKRKHEEPDTINVTLFSGVAPRNVLNKDTEGHQKSSVMKKK